MMFRHGSGGFAGWATLCGALYSACATIGLVCDAEQQNQLVNELMAFYSQHPFPQYQPHGLNFPTTVANSTLCHVSVTKWCKASGFESNSKERHTRCWGVSADTARFTAEILNALLVDNSFTAAYPIAPDVADCMACHSADTRGKESCMECHGDPHEDGF